MNKQIYFIIPYGNKYLSENLDKQLFKHGYPYQKNKLISRVKRKLFLKIKLSVEEYYKDLLCIQEDTIIVFDSCANQQFLLWLSRKYQDRRLIFWYWNPVNICYDISKIPNEYEIWTYSKSDSQLYNINLNTQFYFREKLEVENEINDVFFCGTDKGRAEEVLKYKDIFLRLGLKVDINIVPEKWYKKFMKKYYTSKLTYSEIRKKCISSRAILDYSSVNNSGLSLRPLEAMYYNKKLITNNSTIIEHDIYDENNVYILDEKCDDLKRFLDKPYHKYSDSILEEYSFSSWLSRFTNK